MPRSGPPGEAAGMTMNGCSTAIEVERLSKRYGRQIAFLGADTNDSPNDARTFLAQHPVSYPSYQTTTTNLTSLAAIQGLPTTIYINAAGKITHVHIGQYDTQGTLDQDINTYLHPNHNQ